MSIRRPSPAELQCIANSYNITLTDEEAQVFQQLIDEALNSCDRLDRMTEPKLPVRYARTPGSRPTLEENQFGAWAWKCSIKGQDHGLLQGKRIALKDNVAVAGVPLSNGTRVMDGYIPDIDASIVTRILDSGGEITGKAMCEGSSLGAGSHTSYPWPVRNPRAPERSAGGSSSGSTALVAAGQVDMAIGGDQGGSIRIPASWCGVVGLKPTFGLVPYTGILSNEWTVDHVGPIARTVYDAALLLEAVAGPDCLDPRQAQLPDGPFQYTDAIHEGQVKGLRIGLLREAFGIPNLSDPGVDQAVREAAITFERLGADVREVSVPMHLEGAHIWRGMRIEGTWAVVAQDPGSGHGWFGYYDTHYVDFYGSARRARANDLPANVKLIIVQGHYLADRYHGHYYAKAQNLRRVLAEAYDNILEDVDLLLMPTAPRTASLLGDDLQLYDYLREAADMSPNTCPFNLTGHPAISCPWGNLEGLPVGAMLVGRYLEDAIVLKAAHVLEQAQSDSPGSRL